MADSLQPVATILELGHPFYDPVAPADFPAAILRFRNDRAAAQVGLADLDDAAWIEHFARFRPIAGSLEQPLALRYHGHQFRVYNRDIGDGRGFLFAQLRDTRGRLLDLGTKGSGQTPYSRFGDGRLTLKGGIREVLATEMLEALGVETSRSFSLIETGEALERNDEPSPTRSSVLVRLNHSHIRIGTFQRLAYFQETEALERLTHYVLRNYYGETPGEDAPLRLMELVVDRTARLAGQFMAAGFVHGVLNTDNINITGESFDYGPWRWAPVWNPEFTAAYFDHSRLYAFARQPEAIHWDAMQLAAALRQIVDVEQLIPLLDQFGAHYLRYIVAAMLWRLGLEPLDPDADLTAVQAVEQHLRESQESIDRFFFDAFARPEALPELAGHKPRKRRDHGYWSDPQPCSMLIDEVEAIWKPIAENDDWLPFNAKIAAVRRMGEALA